MDSSPMLPEYMHLLPEEYAALAVPLWQLDARYRFGGRMHTDALYPFFFTADDARRLLREFQNGDAEVLLTHMSVMLFTEETGWEYDDLHSPAQLYEYHFPPDPGLSASTVELHRVSLAQGSAELERAIAAFGTDPDQIRIELIFSKAIDFLLWHANT